jgi:predicted ester cyclase
MMAGDSTALGIVPEEHPRGAEGFKIFYNGFKSRFSKINITVEQVVSEGDYETARLNVKAVETATGKPVEFAGMCMVKITGGKISEAWNNFDFLGMHEQLGMKLAAGE